MEQKIVAQARGVKEASRTLATCSTAKRNSVLKAVAARLQSDMPAILEANREDLERAKSSGLSAVLMDRLLLTPDRIVQMRKGVRDVLSLPDPLGRKFGRVKRPNGLIVERMTVPLGAIGIIYESRPNVTIDAAILCLKSGNTVLLRGGSEAISTNRALTGVLKKSLQETGLPPECVEFVDTTDREAVLVMLKQDEALDVIIPRGSQQLISFIREHSSVPVIAHGEGNCHVYVDRSADLDEAAEIVFNAKVQRPSVCNAAEKLLVHRAVAKKFLPRIARRLLDAGVEIRGDAATLALIPEAHQADEDDWHREYLDLVIAVKTVESLDEAISHINRYGSHHSDAIVTATVSHGERFLQNVDSAAVYVNASTRFTDGYELGLGAEIGISTQKLHARGPMGLAELTTSKFVVHGKGQVRK
ncbi:MAG: glutamate-5-semialdehyde dehydrogenase [Bacteroidota bacterium]